MNNFSPTSIVYQELKFHAPNEILCCRLEFRPTRIIAIFESLLYKTTIMGITATISD